MKYLLIPLLSLLLLGAGCSQNTVHISTSADANNPLNAAPEPPTKTHLAGCFSIQTANREPLFHNVDAQKIFGGTWSNSIEIDDKKLDDGCIYMLREDYKRGSAQHNITLQTETAQNFERLVRERNVKPPETVEITLNGKKTAMRVPVPTYKDINGLGDQALLVTIDNNTTEPILYLHKGDSYAIIHASPVTEDQIVSIGKALLSKWK